jgi:hypothetical protein
VRTLAGFIPFLALVVLSHRLHRRSGSWRTAVVGAAIVWGVAVTALTEGLSLFRMLSAGWVAAAWIGVVAVLAVGYLARRSCPVTPQQVAIIGRWWLPLAGVAVIVSATGFIALTAPPNTTDSMVYHMSRVAHWIQNGSVAHYPTHIPRQLHLAPWAEFAILQLQILTGGDRLANLVQWLAMLGSLIGVSSIARQFGGNVRCQILATVLCATIPMGILQASSTQNDYVLSFWLVCFVYHVRAHMTNPTGQDDSTRAWWIGGSLGLAVLTKATAYIFALPFLVWMVADGAWHRRKRLGRTIAIIALAVLLLNGAHYWRNAQIYGSPLGPGRDGQFIYANEVFGFSTLVSNALRNAALHLGTDNERANAGLERAIAWLHGLIGADLDDPKTTWLGVNFQVTPPMNHEDSVGNPAHLVLIVLSLAILVADRTLGRRPDLILYAAAIVTGFSLFSLYIRWQPWHSRLHLPLFVLWSPLVAVIVGSRRRIAGMLAVILLLLSVSPVVDNHLRPLFGSDSVISRSRQHQYFRNQPDLRQPYVTSIRKLQEARCQNVGLWMEEFPEYQLWVLARRYGGDAPTRIEHVSVVNESASAALPRRASFDPCALLVITAQPSIPFTVSFNRSVYRQTFRSPPVSLFLRE